MDALQINALAKELISLRADISTEDEVYRLLRSTEKERVDADKKAKDVKNAKEVGRRHRDLTSTYARAAGC